ncbi:hypothetical protein IAR50_004585 [Cryptococcus sp. DSM 104548]
MSQYCLHSASPARHVSAPVHPTRPPLTARRFGRNNADYDDYPSARAQANAHSHQPTRPVDKDKTETELSTSIKKATSPEETAPKQKHVRRKGYGVLIKAYTSFLLAKLRFHRHHPEFNGLFEYEEYISLKNIDDPNEGYETITDLMTLQDQIESFQKLIFAAFRGSVNNECRISALVPLVKESFGIYKFITSMLRAMHRRTDAADALLPLRERYNAQHYNLRRFYYECSNLKYLTGLINEPPNLIDNGVAPELPERPTTDKRPERKETPRPPSSPQPTQGEIDEQRRMLEEYERKQSNLVSQREADQRRQEDEKRRQEAEYAEQQRLQQEREAQAQAQLQEQLLRDQMSQQWTNQQASQAAQVQQEMLAMRGQYERDQMLLAQYDGRVKALEQELASIGMNVGGQMSAKDELIAQLQQQIESWKRKYEALAKLYSQLRGEHLDLLNKSKGFQLKANSAQEAIDKMERMERDVKSKNLELADMIRERDRARYDLDRIKSSHREETDRLKRDLSFANERAEDASRHKSTEVSDVMSRYNRQLTELEDSLRSKQLQIDDLLRKLDEKQSEIQHAMDEKDQEILIMQEGMDSTLQELSDLRLNQGDTSQAFDAQIDTLILDHRKELNAIIDSILQASMKKVDDAIVVLEAPMQTGNTTATPEYTLSMIEKAMTDATEFASTFNRYLTKSGGTHVDVIRTANEFCQSLWETLISTKGITRFAENDEASEKLIVIAKQSGDAGYRFFYNLQSFRLLAGGKSEDAALRNNAETRSTLSKLSDTVEKFVPKAKNALNQSSGDIGDIVANEMQNAARAIEEATQRIHDLINRPKDGGRYGSLNTEVHDSILKFTLEIANAIGRLINAAKDSQEEIVREGKGSSTTQQFYKKNNRWTEGLISAAKAVAYATSLLIESADGVISGTHSLEQLIVALNEVSAATAQLVAASRVKASLMSKTQQALEMAAKAVTDACKKLVKHVKLLANAQGDDEAVDYKAMPSHEFKVREMEQQVEILKLEKDLGAARRRLGEMRRAGYHQETD